MLVLTRTTNKSVLIGNGIRVTVIGINRGQVRLGFEAPEGVPIWREELVDKDPNLMSREMPAKSSRTGRHIFNFGDRVSFADPADSGDPDGALFGVIAQIHLYPDQETEYCVCWDKCSKLYMDDDDMIGESDLSLIGDSDGNH